MINCSIFLKKKRSKLISMRWVHFDLHQFIFKRSLNRPHYLNNFHINTFHVYILSDIHFVIPPLATFQ